jgi:hypothetical protein
MFLYFLSITIFSATIVRPFCDSQYDRISLSVAHVNKILLRIAGKSPIPFYIRWASGLLVDTGA